jgi:PD-(D/E)XK endonuclease
VGVEGGGPILRVQVKCTVYRYGEGSYSINVFGPRRGGKRAGYKPGTVDFFALYIIPTDDWFIIPYEVIGDRSATLYFTLDGERQKYGIRLAAASSDRLYSFVILRKWSPAQSAGLPMKDLCISKLVEMRARISSSSLLDLARWRETELAGLLLPNLQDDCFANIQSR